MIDVRNLAGYTDKSECFAITSYCNSENKLRVLSNTIDNIRRYRLPIFLHAHYIVPEDIQKKVDFCYYSSDNPIFNRYNSFFGFTDGKMFGEGIWLDQSWESIHGYKLEITEFDFYYTTLKGWDESIRMLSDYKKIHMINYDTNFYPELFNYSKIHDKSIFLQHNYLPNGVPHIFLLYFCLKKNLYDYFRKNITVDKYIGFWGMSNTRFLPHPEQIVGSFIANNDDIHVVPYTETDFDKILKTDVNTDGRFVWETSLSLDGYKLFIGELFNGKLSLGMHLLFFEVRTPIYVKIITNKNIMPLKTIDSYELINLNMPFNTEEKLEIIVNGIAINSDYIKKFFRLLSKIYII